MSSHTPGPWYVLSDFDIATKSTGTQEYIAVINEEDFRLDLDEDSALDQARANARLIASAPELYEAVKSFLEWAEKGGPLFPREQMERAIDKATGRSHD